MRFLISLCAMLFALPVQALETRFELSDQFEIIGTFTTKITGGADLYFDLYPHIFHSTFHKESGQSDIRYASDTKTLTMIGFEKTTNGVPTAPSLLLGFQANPETDALELVKIVFSEYPGSKCRWAANQDAGQIEPLSLDLTDTREVNFAFEAVLEPRMNRTEPETERSLDCMQNKIISGGFHGTPPSSTWTQ